MLFFPHVCIFFSLIRKDISVYGKLYEVEMLKAPTFLKMYKFRVNFEILKTAIIVEEKLSIFHMLHDIVVP